jgi:DNA-binding transcriptional LysR family regulator
MDLSYRGLHATPVARPMRRERLTLGVACSLNWGPLRRLIGTFRSRAPDIDLAVALHDAGSRGWRSAPLWSEPLMVFMAEGHPLAAQNAVQPDQLRETHLLMAGNGSGDRALQRAIIRALGGPPNFLHYAVQRDNLLDLVSLGFGVTLAGGSAMGAFYPGVCARPLESEAGWLSYCGFWSAENERPALRRFLELRDA